MIEQTPHLFLIVIALILGTRLSSNPVRLFRNRVVETAANTFTTKQIDLPISIVGVNRIHAVEIMWLDLFLGNPSNEEGQNNQTQMQITKDPESILIPKDDENFLWGRQKAANNEFDTSGSSVATHEEPMQYVTADTDGKGTLLAESIIHHSLAGVGNAAADVSTAIGHGYIIALSGSDAIQLLLEEDD